MSPHYHQVCSAVEELVIKSFEFTVFDLSTVHMFHSFTSAAAVPWTELWFTKTVYVAPGCLTHLLIANMCCVRVCVIVFDPSYVCLEGEVTLYHYGLKDSATILFYFFIAIILHAVVQEYLLDVSMQSPWHHAPVTQRGPSILQIYCTGLRACCSCFVDIKRQEKATNIANDSPVIKRGSTAMSK